VHRKTAARQPLALQQCFDGRVGKHDVVTNKANFLLVISLLLLLVESHELSYTENPYGTARMKVFAFSLLQSPHSLFRNHLIFV
jgi:hypothetical protein